MNKLVKFDPPETRLNSLISVNRFYRKQYYRVKLDE